VLAGLWAEVETDRDRMLVEFELTVPSNDITLPGGITPMFSQRPGLLPRRLGDRMIEPSEPGSSP
jgi:hypothetical protein